MTICGWDSKGVKVIHKIQEDIAQAPVPDGYDLIYKDGEAIMIMKGKYTNE